MPRTRCGELQHVLAPHLVRQGHFSALWPSSRQPSPKVRAFVDFASEYMFTAAPDEEKKDNRPPRR